MHYYIGNYIIGSLLQQEFNSRLAADRDNC
jgi:hypothetical protein